MHLPDLVPVELRSAQSYVILMGDSHTHYWAAAPAATSYLRLS